MTGAPPPKHPLHLGVIALLSFLLSLGAPVLAHDDVAGHGHLFVILGDDPTTTLQEPDDRLTYRFEGTLMATAHPDGVAIQMTLPDGATMQHFSARNITGVSSVDGEPRQAELVWSDGQGPAAGEPVPGVRLEAVRTVDPRSAVDVRWAGLEDFDEAAVRIEVTAGMLVTSAGDLVRNLHGAPGRAVWSQIDLDKPALEATIRPAATGDDPTRNAPPNPAAGWLILLAVALITAAVWALGKKLENRLAKDPDPPQKPT